ncbi:hypothetical protein ACFE04_010412 [Oxalis oulophora]
MNRTRFSLRLPFGVETFTPKTEWKIQPDADILTLYIPGFRRNHVKWTVEESRMIRVSGDRPQMGTSKSRQFNEAYVLPENVKRDRIVADFDEDGVLKFMLPKEIFITKQIISPTTKDNETISETKLNSSSKEDGQEVVQEKKIKNKTTSDREQEISKEGDRQVVQEKKIENAETSDRVQEISKEGDRQVVQEKKIENTKMGDREQEFSKGGDHQVVEEKKIENIKTIDREEEISKENDYQFVQENIIENTKTIDRDQEISKEDDHQFTSDVEQEISREADHQVVQEKKIENSKKSDPEENSKVDCQTVHGENTENTKTSNLEEEIEKVEPKKEEEEEEEEEEEAINKNEVGESRGSVVKKAGVGFIVMAVGAYVSYRLIRNRRSKSRLNTD